MNPSSNLILVGPMGAGKTSIGRRLARAFGLDFVDADQAIEADSGARIPLIFELEGEAGFRARERAMLERLCAGEGQLIATGGGAVLDPANRALLSRSGFVVYLAASVAQQLHRLERDRSRPLLAAPDRRERLEQLAAQRIPLYEAVADLRFACEGHSVPNATAQLQRRLQQAWRRTPLDAGMTA